MWKTLREFWGRVWRRGQKISEERKVQKERARFWDEVREGEREAEAKAHR